VLRCTELPVIDNLRTRLLSLRLLETVLLLPADTGPSQLEPSEQRHIVDTLLSVMSAAMWSSAVPEAIRTVARRKRQMEARSC